MLNQPNSPAERLFEESTRVRHFSAQLALLTARPPEQNPRLALGCVTFWAEHDRGPVFWVLEDVGELYLEDLTNISLTAVSLWWGIAGVILNYTF